jgi:hypothetical protein
MGDGFITFHETAKYVTDNVTLWAQRHGRSQTPTTDMSQEGDILLTRVSSDTTETPIGKAINP